MLEALLRRKTDQIIVLPLAKQLQSWAIGSPNRITLLACLLGVLVIPSVFFGRTWLAVALLLLSGYCDMLDGVFARLQQKTSVFGSYLDIFADRVVEFSVILALMLVDPAGRGMYGVLMLGSVMLCITTFLLVGIFSEQQGEKQFHYSTGLMERAEAFIFFIAMLLLPHWFIPLSLLFTFLVLLTALIRSIEFYRLAK